MPPVPVAPMDSHSAPRHAFLDGVRGLAALYVVVHHAWYEGFAAGGQQQWHPLVLALTSWLFYGHHAVDVFIVVSGFCLGMPLAGSTEKRIPGGLKQFFARRARRILPPYYAALAMSLLLIAAVPVLSVSSGDRWDRALPGIRWDAIGSHLLLIHNLFPALIWQINPPMWSIATEWQIYFLFALVLVPVYRRLGMVAAICVAVLVGSVPGLFTRRFDEACPWFAGLFAMGWLAALVAHSDGAVYASLRRRIPWRMLARSALVLYLMLILLTDLLRSTGELGDCFVGLVAAIVILDLTLGNRIGLRQMILESRPCRWLGACSYSLYLIHFPLIAWAHLSMTQAGLSPQARLALMLLLAVPPTVVAGYGFSLVFERPFLAVGPKRHSQRRRPAGAIISPRTQATPSLGRYSQ